MAPLVQNEVDLPVLDMSEFPLNFDGQQGKHQFENHPMVAKLREACKEWGFFSVVNHGVSESLQRNLESVIRELCELPQEVKEKAVNPALSESYVRNTYAENFTFLNVPQSNSVQELSESIWPNQGNPKFCETVRAYTLVLADLGSKIIKMILASLGLDVESVYQSEFEGFTGNMRINHYFEGAGGKTMEEEMLFAHTDIGFFTILYQDNEGGLQIRSKEGAWLNVKPLSNSFVINVADTLKVWSNGRYHSGEHRVVYKGWKNRLSLPFFVQFPEDKQIWAPAELVDNEYPRRYRPYTFSQFKKDYFKNLHSSNYTKPGAFIDMYAGV